MFKSKPVPQLNPSLLPAHYDSWGAPTEKHVEKASQKRLVWFMPWHPQVVAEGYVEPENMDLRRALREEKIL